MGKRPERKIYEDDLRLGETLYRLYFSGGESFPNLTEQQIREKLQELDPKSKLIKGKDYTVKPINND